jgi:hypothetical protein
MAGRPRGREEVVPLMYEDEAARPRFGHREGGLQVQQQRRAGGGGAGENVGEGRAGAAGEGTAPRQCCSFVGTERGWRRGAGEREEMATGKESRGWGGGGRG